MTNDRRNGDDMAYPCQGPNVPAYGLTKRELFAAMAMQALCAPFPDSRDPITWDFHSLAQASVKAADSLLEALGSEHDRIGPKP